MTRIVWPRGPWKRTPAALWPAFALLAPVALLYGLLLIAPLGFLASISLLPSQPNAPLTGSTTFGTYAEMADPYIAGILVRTIRISALTTLFCLVLGYPVAVSLSRSRGVWRTIQMVLVISPLFVSIVVRTYGWMLLLGGGGPINALLTGLGLPAQRFLGTEGAVVIGLTEALLPFMVLSLVAVLERIDPALEEAARGLGSSAFGAFCRVTLPLSRPGALAGSLLVFMVCMGSFATPALLGGSAVRVMVTEIYTQVTTVFNWPLGAALAMALLAVSLAFVLAAGRLAGPGRVSGAA